MVQYVKFDPSDPEPFRALGLNLEAVSNILLGPTRNILPNLLPDSPSWAQNFVNREYRASDITFSAIAEARLVTPHPVTGVPTQPSYDFIRVAGSVAPLTIFKAFGDTEARYCLAFAGLTGRVTHIVVPSLNCVIYDLDAPSAAAIWRATIEEFANHQAVSGFGPRIGIIDMVTNFAHQAMNHLSGLARLIESGGDHNLDEIWVFGTEFFGPTENLFPEVAQKIRHLERRHAISKVDALNCDVYRLGSNVLTASLRTRILGLAGSSESSNVRRHQRHPVVAFTVRSEGRRARNLPDVVAEVVTALMQGYPSMGVILDGWVFPEDAIIACSSAITALSGAYRDRMEEEAALCVEIARRLPPGVLIGNTIGTSILESISKLQAIDAYVAHIGTLQHKIGWFTETFGIVHGPTAELIRLESGTYSCEVGCPPAAIRCEDVVDVPVDNPRGAGFYDYNIVDASTIVSELSTVLDKRTSSK